MRVYYGVQVNTYDESVGVTIMQNTTNYQHNQHNQMISENDMKSILKPSKSIVNLNKRVGKYSTIGNSLFHDGGTNHIETSPLVCKAINNITS